MELSASALSYIAMALGLRLRQPNRAHRVYLGTTTFRSAIVLQCWTWRAKICTRIHLSNATCNMQYVCAFMCGKSAAPEAKNRTATRDEYSFFPFPLSRFGIRRDLAARRGRTRIAFLGRRAIVECEHFVATADWRFDISYKYIFCTVQKSRAGRSRRTADRGVGQCHSRVDLLGQPRIFLPVKANFA